MLLYGPSGHGKTRFVADAPKPLWIDFEDSTETLYNWPEYQGIPLVVPKDINDIISKTRRAVSDPDIETVVIDTISTGFEFALRAYMEAQDRDKFNVYEGDYKYLTQVFQNLFGILQRADINVVIIGHERFITNDAGSLVKIVPDLPPKLQGAAQKLFNVVAYLKLKPNNDPAKRVRELYINPSGLIEAKNRLNIQETFLVNPEWKDLYNE